MLLLLIAFFIGVGTGALTRSLSVVGVLVVLLGALVEFGHYLIGYIHQSQHKPVCISFDGAPCTSSTPVFGAAHFFVSHWLVYCAVTAIGACVGTLLRKWRGKSARR